MRIARVNAMTNNYLTSSSQSISESSNNFEHSSGSMDKLRANEVLKIIRKLMYNYGVKYSSHSNLSNSITDKNICLETEVATA